MQSAANLFDIMGRIVWYSIEEVMPFTFSALLQSFLKNIRGPSFKITKFSVTRLAKK